MRKINRISEYVGEVPEDVKIAIKALSDDTRLAIVVALLKHGEFTYSQLMETLGINSSVLSHHLKNLVGASLVKNYYTKRPDSEEYSFYDLTSYGEEFLRSIYGMLDMSDRLEQAIARVCGAHKSYEIEPMSYLLNPREGVILEIEKTQTRMLLRREKPKFPWSYMSEYEEK